MSVIRFPPHRSACVWLVPEELGGWLIVAGSYRWSFGSYDEALCEAQCLAASLHVTLREVAP